MKSIEKASIIILFTLFLGCDTVYPDNREYWGSWTAYFTNETVLQMTNIPYVQSTTDPVLGNLVIRYQEAFFESDGKYESLDVYYRQTRHEGRMTPVMMRRDCNGKISTYDFEESDILLNGDGSNLSRINFCDQVKAMRGFWTINEFNDEEKWFIATYNISGHSHKVKFNNLRQTDAFRIVDTPCMLNKMNEIEKNLRVHQSSHSLVTSTVSSQNDLAGVSGDAMNELVDSYSHQYDYYVGENIHEIIEKFQTGDQLNAAEEHGSEENYVKILDESDIEGKWLAYFSNRRNITQRVNPSSKYRGGGLDKIVIIFDGKSASRPDTSYNIFYTHDHSSNQWIASRIDIFENSGPIKTYRPTHHHDHEHENGTIRAKLQIGLCGFWKNIRYIRDRDLVMADYKVESSGQFSSNEIPVTFEKIRGMIPNMYEMVEGKT